MLPRFHVARNICCLRWDGEIAFEKTFILIIEANPQLKDFTVVRRRLTDAVKNVRRDCIIADVLSLIVCEVL